MGRYLIDNNVISNFFSGKFSAKGMDFISEVIDQTPIISVITEIEALSWISIDKSKEQILKTFVLDSTILGLSKEVVAKCIGIRRNRKTKTPDAIIASTAIVHNLTLITSDKDYSNILGLDIIDTLTL